MFSCFKKGSSQRTVASVYVVVCIVVLQFLLSSFKPFRETLPPTINESASRQVADTKGGEGGDIIRVTNLNSSGPGSFFEAVRTEGKRIVVFEVGGVIDLDQRVVNIVSPYLTISGQTAPDPGITFINGGILVSTHDVIVQHLRIRTGNNGRASDWSPDALATSRAYNVIIDHCSLSWGIDENLSASGPRFEGETPDEWRKNTSHRITFSNNIIAEGLSYSNHPSGEHSKGTLIHDNVTDVLIYQNLYANNVDRNPYLKGGTTGVIANNYIYNPGKIAMQYRLATREWESRAYQMGKWTIVGNVMQHGPSSDDIAMLDIGNGPAKIYMQDNLAFKYDRSPGEIISGAHTKVVKSKPIWFDELTIRSSDEVKQIIIENVGARPWNRDEHDQRIIESVVSNDGRVINSELEVGGYPRHRESRAIFREEDWDIKTMTRQK